MVAYVTSKCSESSILEITTIVLVADTLFKIISSASVPVKFLFAVCKDTDRHGLQLFAYGLFG